MLTAALTGNVAKLSTFSKEGTLDTLDGDGLSAVLRTVKLNRLDATKLLIDAGANIDAHDPKSTQNVIDQTAFLYAGAMGNNAAIKLLLTANPKVDIYNHYGGTALIPAAEKGHVETVKLLLEDSSIDVNHVNYLGWTALMEAVLLSDRGLKQVQIIKLLLEHGADQNIPDKDGVSVLQHASLKGYGEIIKILKSF